MPSPSAMWYSAALQTTARLNNEDGYNFGGAVDDIWKKPSGELIVVDVKSTAKNIFDWEDTYSKWEYAKGYKRQLEMYQWLMRMNGFEVAPEAYLVYYNGKKNEPHAENALPGDQRRSPVRILSHFPFPGGAAHRADARRPDSSRPGRRLGASSDAVCRTCRPALPS